jgi:hypothetical protein
MCSPIVCPCSTPALLRCAGKRGSGFQPMRARGLHVGVPSPARVCRRGKVRSLQDACATLRCHAALLISDIDAAVAGRAEGAAVEVAASARRLQQVGGWARGRRALDLGQQADSKAWRRPHPKQQVGALRAACVRAPLAPLSQQALERLSLPQESSTSRPIFLTSCVAAIPPAHPSGAVRG